MHYLDIVEFLNDSGKVCKRFQGVTDLILEDFVTMFLQQTFTLKTNLAEHLQHISDHTGLTTGQINGIISGVDSQIVFNPKIIQNDAFLLNCTTDILNSNEVYSKFKPYLFKITSNLFLNRELDWKTFYNFAIEKTKFIKCISSLNYIPRVDFFYSFKHSHFTEFIKLVKATSVLELALHFNTIIEIQFEEDYIMEFMNMFLEEDPKIISPYFLEDELIIPPFYPFKVSKTEIIKNTFYVKLSIPCRWFLNQRTTSVHVLRKTSLKYDKTHLFNDISKFKEDKEGDFFPNICLSFPKFYLGFELLIALARNKHEHCQQNKYLYDKNIETILKVIKVYFKYLTLKNFITPMSLSDLVDQFAEGKKNIETTIIYIIIHNGKIKIYTILFSFNVVNFVKYKIEMSESKDARAFLSNLVNCISTTENFYLFIPFLIRSKENTEMLFDLNNIIRGLIDIKVTGKIYFNLSGNDFSYFIINVLLDSEAMIKNAKEISIFFAYNEIQEKSVDFILKLKLAANLTYLRLNFSYVKGFDQQCLMAVKSKLDASDFNKYLVLGCKGTNLKQDQAVIFIQSYQLEYQSLKLSI